jgi:hypothetical protein
VKFFFNDNWRNAKGMWRLWIHIELLLYSKLSHICYKVFSITFKEEILI